MLPLPLPLHFPQGARCPKGGFSRLFSRAKGSPCFCAPKRRVSPCFCTPKPLTKSVLLCVDSLTFQFKTPLEQVLENPCNVLRRLVGEGLHVQHDLNDVERMHLNTHECMPHILVFFYVWPCAQRLLLRVIDRMFLGGVHAQENAGMD